MSISWHDALMLAILALVLLLVVRSIDRRNKSQASKLNLDDLLLGSDGKASKAAFVMGGSFLVTSWIVIFQTLNKTLSDLTFAAYVGAWVVPAVTVLIKGSQNSNSETTIPPTPPRGSP
jgi:hypothetical protein